MVSFSVSHLQKKKKNASSFCPEGFFPSPGNKGFFYVSKKKYISLAEIDKVSNTNFIARLCLFRSNARENLKWRDKSETKVLSGGNFRGMFDAFLLSNQIFFFSYQNISIQSADIHDSPTSESFALGRKISQTGFSLFFVERRCISERDLCNKTAARKKR